MSRSNIDLLEMRKILSQHFDEGEANGSLTKEGDPKPSLTLSAPEF
jgi:hypothetical protein